jgi:hypothetical protein
MFQFRFIMAFFASAFAFAVLVMLVALFVDDLRELSSIDVGMRSLLVCVAIVFCFVPLIFAAMSSKSVQHLKDEGNRFSNDILRRVILSVSSSSGPLYSVTINRSFVSPSQSSSPQSPLSPTNQPVFTFSPHPLSDLQQPSLLTFSPSLSSSSSSFASSSSVAIGLVDHYLMVTRHQHYLLSEHLQRLPLFSFFDVPITFGLLAKAAYALISVLIVGLQRRFSTV